jgi:hypothetical protein
LRGMRGIGYKSANMQNPLIIRENSPIWFTGKTAWINSDATNFTFNYYTNHPALDDYETLRSRSNLTK